MEHTGLVYTQTNTLTVLDYHHPTLLRMSYESFTTMMYGITRPNCKWIPASYVDIIVCTISENAQKGDKLSMFYLTLHKNRVDRMSK